MKTTKMKTALLIGFLFVASTVSMDVPATSGDVVVESDEKNISGMAVEIDTATVYHPVAGQTDSMPYVTADGSVIDTTNPAKHRWVALSRDLLQCSYRAEMFKDTSFWRGDFSFGDTVMVLSDDDRINGLWVVRDCMNKKYKKRIDFLQGKGDIYGRWTNLVIVRKKS